MSRTTLLGRGSLIPSNSGKEPTRRMGEVRRVEEADATLLLKADKDRLELQVHELLQERGNTGENVSQQLEQLHTLEARQTQEQYKHEAELSSIRYALQTSYDTIGAQKQEIRKLQEQLVVQAREASEKEKKQFAKQEQNGVDVVSMTAVSRATTTTSNTPALQGRTSNAVQELAGLQSNIVEEQKQSESTSQYIADLRAKLHSKQVYFKQTLRTMGSNSNTTH